MSRKVKVSGMAVLLPCRAARSSVQWFSSKLQWRNPQPIPVSIENAGPTRHGVATGPPGNAMPLRRETLRQRNVALYASAIRSITDGDTGPLHQLGMTARHVPHLLQLSISEVFDLADHGLDLAGYLHQVTGKSADKLLREALIGHGAPRELVVQVFGMSSRRYAAERLRLGVAATAGRPNTRALDVATEHRIWRLWTLLANPGDPARLREADHWLLIALDLPQQLRAAWSLIQRWARQADALLAFAGDRERLSLMQQQRAEHDLREKHGLPTGSALQTVEAGAPGGPQARSGTDRSREPSGQPRPSTVAV